MAGRPTPWLDDAWRHGGAPVGDKQRGDSEDDRWEAAPRKEDGQRCSPGRDEHRHSACSAMVLSAAAAPGCGSVLNLDVAQYNMFLNITFSLLLKEPLIHLLPNSVCKNEEL
jgi:hypothetical protein